MLRKALIAAFAAVSLAAPSIAAECIPVPTYEAQIERAGFSPDDVYRTSDVGIVNEYTKALGFPIPDGAAPVGLIIVTAEDRALVLLVENEGGKCVRYSAVIPIGLHNSAFRTATRAA